MHMARSVLASFVVTVACAGQLGKAGAFQVHLQCCPAPTASSFHSAHPQIAACGTAPCPAKVHRLRAGADDIGSEAGSAVGKENTEAKKEDDGKKGGFDRRALLFSSLIALPVI